MNTATRVLQTRSYQTTREGWLQISSAGIRTAVMVLCLLSSAFGVIYLKDLNRRLFIQYQGLQQVRQQYETGWGKLLLEQSAWSTQARIQKIAQQKLGMVVAQPRYIAINTPRQ